jgi:NDP-sugar pyrophosphorylase family protein
MSAVKKEVTFEQITPFILAGGEGTRMGIYGEYCPKPLMVAYNQSLLQRNLNFLALTGFKKAIISTRESFFKTIESHIFSICSKDFSLHNIKANVINNPQHKSGSLEALLWGLDFVSTKWVLMCFSDIFFLENPFIELASLCRGGKDILGISPITKPDQLTKGGIVYQKEGLVSAIYERPSMELKMENSFRWNGIALFETETGKIELKQFLETVNKPALPEGDFFEFRRKSGRQIFCHRTSDFINVNSLDDLLVASIHAALEKKSRMTSTIDANALYQSTLNISNLINC